MFKKIKKAFKLSKNLNGLHVDNYMVIECLSTISCKCGSVYTHGKLLGNEITLDHKPNSKCINNKRKYLLIADNEKPI